MDGRFIRWFFLDLIKLSKLLFFHGKCWCFCLVWWVYLLWCAMLSGAAPARRHCTALPAWSRGRRRQLGDCLVTVGTHRGHCHRLWRANYKSAPSHLLTSSRHWDLRVRCDLPIVGARVQQQAWGGGRISILQMSCVSTLAWTLAWPCLCLCRGKLNGQWSWVRKHETAGVILSATVLILVWLHSFYFHAFSIESNLRFLSENVFQKKIPSHEDPERRPALPQQQAAVLGPLLLHTLPKFSHHNPTQLFATEWNWRSSRNDRARLWSGWLSTSFRNDKYKK